PPPRSPLFPYTPLFRSLVAESLDDLLVLGPGLGRLVHGLEAAPGLVQRCSAPLRLGVKDVGLQQLAHGGVVFLLGKQTLADLERSEEHTSELQSRENLV